MLWTVLKDLRHARGMVLECFGVLGGGFCEVSSCVLVGPGGVLESYRGALGVLGNAKLSNVNLRSVKQISSGLSSSMLSTAELSICEVRMRLYALRR